MMHVFMLVMGTRGDVELFVMLGRELRRRGHRVSLGTSPFYGDRVSGAGLEFVPIGAGTRAELVSICRSLAPVRDRRARVEAYYQKWVRPQTHMAAAEIKRQVARADYVINNLKSVWQRAGETMPGAIVTYDPPGSIENLAKYASRLTKNKGRILELVAMNRQLIDPDGRWGEPYRFTGFWTSEESVVEGPSEGLARFLAAGPAPVVVTMGSMVAFEVAGFMRTIIEALRLAGQRGIFVSSWSDIPATTGVPESICVVNEVPYDWLFPRSCCVVHHGGCGTVAWALRAGKPSVLLPQITSQEHFAAILERERLASGSFDPNHVRPGELADAIGRALSDDRHIAAARRWQKIVSEETGIATAAELIEQHVEKLRAG